MDNSVLGDVDNKHKYEAQYMVEGLEEDVEIIKAIFSKPKKVHTFVDTDPCQDKHSIQVCTVKRGCWCEQKNNPGLAADEQGVMNHNGAR